MEPFFSLDLGQTPSVLAALSDPAIAQRVADSAAEQYTTDVLDWVAEGKSFTPRHGAAGLEGAISWRPVGGGSAVVYANKDYAPYIEEGTGTHAGRTPWVIRPKDGRKGLKIPVGGGGGYVVRRAVTHPGGRPFPFMFSDLATREAHVLDAARSVLMEAMAHG